MNQRLHIGPPAPPPSWQSEPLVENSTRGFGSSANLVLLVVLFGLGCVILVVLSIGIRNRWRFDLRSEERRLRAILARHPRIGSAAAWLSSSAIEKRLDAIGADEPTVRTIERLKTIEACRFGPGRLE